VLALNGAWILLLPLLFPLAAGLLPCSALPPHFGLYELSRRPDPAANRRRHGMRSNVVSLAVVRGAMRAARQRVVALFGTCRDRAGHITSHFGYDQPSRIPRLSPRAC